MIVTGRLDRANRRLVMTDAGNVPLHKNVIIASPEGDRPSPTAYLVEQDSHVVVRSHFHVGSQFQVVVAGSGSLGRNPIKPFVVHYVAPHTGYGPITAGEEGLAYLTLRPLTVPGGGAQYLPDSRDKLDLSLPKRQISSNPFEPLGSEAQACVTEMIAPQADGLAAWIVHLPPRKTSAPPPLDRGSGRFYVVAKGEMSLAGERVQELGIAWATTDERAFALEAGPPGVDVIVMQFPANAW